MKDFFDNNRIIRLFLAVFCPPLAVADRGCAVFIQVFIEFQKTTPKGRGFLKFNKKEKSEK